MLRQYIVREEPGVAEVQGYKELPEEPEADLLCLRCGYNLRGLDAASNCPECGFQIERSRNGSLLHFASDRDLASLLRGVRFVLIAACLALYSWMLFGLFWGYRSAEPGAASQAVLSCAELVALTSALFVAPGLYLAGWLLLTRQEGNDSAFETTLSSRRLTHWLTLLLAAAHLVWILPMLLSYFTTDSLLDGALPALSVAVGVLLVLHLTTALRHLQVLGRQLGIRSTRARLKTQYVILSTAAVCFTAPFLVNVPGVELLLPLGACCALTSYILLLTGLAECGGWLKHILRQRQRQREEQST